jgi:hypothetical protein
LTALSALAVAGALTSHAQAQYQGYPAYPPYPVVYGQAPPPAMLPPGQLPPSAMQPPAPKGQLPPPQTQQPAPTQGAPGADCDRYGFHPVLKSIFGIRRHCTTCDPQVHRKVVQVPHLGISDWFHSLCKRYGPPEPERAPYAEGGTLAFPNHPFARSPRDFFMVDQH